MPRRNCRRATVYMLSLSPSVDSFCRSTNLSVLLAYCTSSLTFVYSIDRTTMSTHSHAFILTFLTFLLFTSDAVAASIVPSHGTSRARRHSRNLSSTASSTITKRVDNARLTYYKAGQGACGATNNDGDWVSKPHCSPILTIDTDRIGMILLDRRTQLQSTSYTSFG